MPAGSCVRRAPGSQRLVSAQPPLSPLLIKVKSRTKITPVHNTPQGVKELKHDFEPKSMRSGNMELRRNQLEREYTTSCQRRTLIHRFGIICLEKSEASSSFKFSFVCSNNHVSRSIQSIIHAPHKEMPQAARREELVPDGTVSNAELQARLRGPKSGC